MRQRNDRQDSKPGDPKRAVTAEIRKLGAALLDQQMWCWGCDVRREAGNLLLAYGMERRPSPEVRYRSAYTGVLQSGGTITLWGWGVWVAQPDQGSVFVSRSYFRVRYSRDAEMMPTAWCETQLPPLNLPRDDASRKRCAHLLRNAFDWIAAYECWLEGYLDSNYRDQTIASWPQRRRHHGGIPACAVAGHWAQLARMMLNQPL